MFPWADTLEDSHGEGERGEGYTMKSPERERGRLFLRRFHPLWRRGRGLRSLRTFSEIGQPFRAPAIDFVIGTLAVLAEHSAIGRVVCETYDATRISGAMSPSRVSPCSMPSDYFPSSRRDLLPPSIISARNSGNRRWHKDVRGAGSSD